MVGRLLLFMMKLVMVLVIGLYFIGLCWVGMVVMMVVLLFGCLMIVCCYEFSFCMGFSCLVVLGVESMSGICDSSVCFDVSRLLVCWLWESRMMLIGLILLVLSVVGVVCCSIVLEGVWYLLGGLNVGLMSRCRLLILMMVVGLLMWVRVRFMGVFFWMSVLVNVVGFGMWVRCLLLWWCVLLLVWCG